MVSSTTREYPFQLQCFRWSLGNVFFVRVVIVVSERVERGRRASPQTELERGDTQSATLSRDV